MEIGLIHIILNKKHVVRGSFGSAASDMLVIPLYYSALTAMIESRVLRRWFPGRRISDEEFRMNDVQKGDEQSNKHDNHIEFTKFGIRGLITILLTPLVWSIVAISALVEGGSSRMQGFGIAMIAALSSLVSRALSKLPQKNMLSEIREVTQQLSNMFYYMLLSVIGVSMNLRRLTVEGHWSTCSSILFATVPLIVHFAVIILGSLASMRLFPNYKLGIEQLVVASNACICGPFTAAALVGKLAKASSSGRNKKNVNRWKGLALASTFWGVVGYAVATSVGISISSILLRMMVPDPI